jgi:hypothetical protein
MSNIWNEKTETKLAELYTGDNRELQNIADNMGTTLHSVRSKLVNMELYEAPDAKKKVGGASSIRKMDIVRSIAGALDLNPKILESFEKATKPELEALLTGIGEAHEMAFNDGIEQAEHDFVTPEASDEE